MQQAAAGGIAMHDRVREQRKPQSGIDGGRGVGRVTLPGLPAPVGEAAINPAPRAQIAAAVKEALDTAGRNNFV